MENIFKFLKKLQINNNREWFNDNKDEYLKTKEEAMQFFTSVAEELNQLDDFADFKMYRIYRDVRFSKDKTPYKEHFAALFPRRQPYNRGSFYLQLKPGGSMIGGGFWNPNKEDLLRIRKTIEIEDDLPAILADPKLKATFGRMEGSQLKTAPKGFDKEHERIELLRYKQFLMRRPLSDDEVKSTELIKIIRESYQAIQPFFRYMTEVLTTDENGELIV